MGLILKIARGGSFVFRLADGREIRAVYESRRGNEIKLMIEAPQDVVITREKMLKTWGDFVNDLGARESSGDYKAVNQFGFLGRYQFGLARLTDFGLCARIIGTNGGGNHCFKWIAPFSEASFLATPSLQDACFEIHVSNLRREIAARFMDLFLKPTEPITMSGAIAIAHLLGLGGLAKYAGGADGSDANGTYASEYLRLFNGYEIPLDLMTPDDFGRRYNVYPTVATV